MLKVSATAYVKLGQRIEEGRLTLLVVEQMNVAWSEGDKTRLRKTMEAIRDHAATLGLETTEECFSEWLEHDRIPKSMREWDYMTDPVTKELSRKLFLFVPSSVAKYYENEDILSEDARSAFPTAHKDLVEAGNCLTAGRYVAAVFHAMLAAETGVRVFGTALGVQTKGPIEYAEWQTILNGMKQKIEDIENQPKSDQKDTDVSFFSEGAAQFRFFKSGWRMKTAHGRGDFDEPRAIEAVDHVASFVEIISTRLHE